MPTGKNMKISNIVATVELIKPFDISFLNKNIKGTVRDPKVHWLKYRIPYNNSYIAFYKSGKFVVNAKSFEQIDNNINFVLEKLEEIGISTIGWKLKIQNLVISDSIDLPSSIEKLIENLDPKKASFEPEQFPALVYKDWGVNFLIFSTGRIILTGAKSMEEARAAIEKLQEYFNHL